MNKPTVHCMWFKGAQEYEALIHKCGGHMNRPDILSLEFVPFSLPI